MSSLKKVLLAYGVRLLIHANIVTLFALVHMQARWDVLVAMDHFNVLQLVLSLRDLVFRRARVRHVAPVVFSIGMLRGERGVVDAVGSGAIHDESQVVDVRCIWSVVNQLRGCLGAGITR